MSDRKKSGSKRNSYRRKNKAIRNGLPGGNELLDAMEVINNMHDKIRRSANEGDRIAAAKLSVAQVAVDRLHMIRDAMVKYLDGE